MKNNKLIRPLSAALAAVTLLLTLGGCGGAKPAPAATAAPAETAMPAETASPAAPADTAAPAETAEPQIASERQDGERFETFIVLEGMEEPVRYEHVRSEALGLEMDYDYELFTRHSEPERECFVCIYDDPAKPENYLEVTRSAEDAETVAVAIGDALSKEYAIDRAPFTLDGAGECIRIDASADVGGKTMPDQLQMVYIIPATDGCRVATAHYAIEGAEGFGRRFAYMMHTLSVID